MRLFSSLLLFVCISNFIYAQSIEIKGTIKDEKGSPVPFASVYEKGTTRGTSANSDGEYQLKLSAGQHTLIFKALGFTQAIIQIDLKTAQTLDIVLQPSVYELKDVIIRADAEDPAYELIKNAIRKRKRHLTEVEKYTADVYIKGMQKLLSAPKKFLGKDINEIGKQIGLDSNRRGILYLSESESKISYIQPDKLREEMISSKVSGSNRSFSFNRASDVKINFYENFLNLDDLSNRPFISPIADNALFYYKYKFLGSSIENGEMVNKIEIIPKRAADPVFRGTIYILEDSWRIHSVDLYLTKEANINVLDTLNIRQEFIPVKSKIWMPSSIRYDFTGGFLGFRFGGYFIALYKNYDFEVNLNKKDFTEVLKITKEVNKRDSSYWQQARPIPLTAEEQIDYLKKETLAAKRESKSYLDSLDAVNNKFKPLKFIIGSGYNPRNRYQKEFYRFSSLLNSLYYNTVEGFGLDYQASYSKQIDSNTNKYLSLGGKIRYGFASEKMYANMFGTIPLQNSKISIFLGSDVSDLNNLTPLSQLGNMVNTLYYERNLLKVYERKFISISYSKSLGSVQTSFSAGWSNRSALKNTTNYKIRDLESKEFTSNNPLMPNSDSPMFPENQAFKIQFNASYAFSNDYATYPTGRYYRPSKYPKLNFSYIKGISGLLGSDIDFDQLAIDLSKSDIKSGLFGSSSFWIGTGKFINSKSLYFVDYKHFMGNRLFSYSTGTNNFLFLDYYKSSTPQRYFEAHLQHNFSGFLTNKLPYLRKLKLGEIIGFNYLSTPKMKNYSEAYVGLQYLNFRLVYGRAFQNTKIYDDGFRFGIVL